MRYVTDAQLQPAQDELNQCFLVGNLCSQSPMWEIVPYAIDCLNNHNLPVRKSLYLMMIRKAKYNLTCVIMKTRQEIES